MKLMFASDIHGSELYCSRVLELYHQEQADKLILLGDLLYHVEGEENYRLLAPAAGLAAEDGTLPMLGTVTITEMQADGDV